MGILGFDDAEADFSKAFEGGGGGADLGFTILFAALVVFDEAERIESTYIMLVQTINFINDRKCDKK